MKMMEAVIQVAHMLYANGLVSGSSGNISFKENDTIYISESGSCFGTLDNFSFTKITLNGKILEGKPSKEYPLHLAMYQANANTHAVIHTHSFYSTLFSCRKNASKEIGKLCSYTPYLHIQTQGNIDIISYHEPGSKALFDDFTQHVQHNTKACILKNHGLIVSGETIWKAYYLMEEFETSAKLLFHIEHSKDVAFDTII